MFEILEGTADLNLYGLHQGNLGAKTRTVCPDRKGKMKVDQVDISELVWGCRETRFSGGSVTIVSPACFEANHHVLNQRRNMLPDRSSGDQPCRYWLRILQNHGLG